MAKPEGPFIVWENYGYEGWQPKSYATLREALEDQRYQSEFVVTKLAEYQVVEIVRREPQPFVFEDEK